MPPLVRSVLEFLGAPVYLVMCETTHVNEGCGGKTSSYCEDGTTHSEVEKVFSDFEPALQCAAGKNAGTFRKHDIEDTGVANITQACGLSEGSVKILRTDQYTVLMATPPLSVELLQQVVLAQANFIRQAEARNGADQWAGIYERFKVERFEVHRTHP